MRELPHEVRQREGVVYLLWPQQHEGEEVVTITKTFTNSAWVCVDCLFAIEYGVREALQAENDGPLKTAHARSIQVGLSKGRWTYIGNENLDATFSSAMCGCCGSYLAGSRHLAEVEVTRP